MPAKALPDPHVKRPRGAAGPRTRAVAGGKGRLVPGKHVTVRFDRMGTSGEALASVDGRVLAVPYAAPGEEATVRLLEVRPDYLRGQIIALRSVSTRITRPRCPHFGRCGGCQWQHLEYPVQLEQKTLFVREALEQVHLAVPVDGAIGWEPPWEFHSRLHAVVSHRDGRPVLGFFAWGGERVVDIKTCPVQHPGNVAALNAVRAAWEYLAPAVQRGRVGPGRLRGILARVGGATGDVMLGLAVDEPLAAAGRVGAVGALLDRVPGLVSIVEVRVPRRGHVARGRRVSLLWGRAYIREEVAGVRYHLPALAEFPANGRAFPGLIEMVLEALDAGQDDVIFEPDAGIGAYTLHLALGAGRAVGITTDGDLEAAWGNARLNRISNCMFYARDPLRALEKARRGGSVQRAFLHPPGRGLPPGMPEALRRAEITRAVYLGRALPALGRDAAAMAEAGYTITRVQPVDLTPQTSHVAALVTCVLQ